MRFFTGGSVPGESSTRYREWLRRPVPLWARLSLLILACVFPVWMLLEPLDIEWLKFPELELRVDDYFYFGSSRTVARTLENLWQPHNSHVVPVFRLWTCAVFSVAGRWQYLPAATALATYLVLVVSMLLIWRLLKRETGNDAIALGAMFGFGVSVVTQPALTWYAASQTLWAGLGIVATLCVLQSWRERPGWLRMVGAFVAASIAAGSWSGGFMVGPIAAAYLGMDGRWHCRKAAWIWFGATVLGVLLLIALKGSQLTAAEKLGGRSVADAISPVSGVVYTVRAIAEFLLIRNLGLDVATPWPQQLVYFAILMLVLFWTRCGRGRITGLELAGAIMVIGSFLLVYTVRGYLPFDSVRELRWYCTLPQIGATMLLGAWLAGVGAGSGTRLTRGGCMGVLMFAAAMSLLHRSASNTLFLNTAPRLAESERALVLTPDLRMTRARRFLAERIDHQRRFLAQLDQIETVSKRFGLARAEIVRALDRLAIPGLPAETNGFDLLDLPVHGSEADPAVIRQRLGRYMIEEPVARPPWLDPDEPWPPQ